MVFNYVIGKSLNKTCKDKNKGFSKKSNTGEYLEDLKSKANHWLHRQSNL